jgi:hypothetical protein
MIVMLFSALYITFHYFYLFLCFLLLLCCLRGTGHKGHGHKDLCHKGMCHRGTGHKGLGHKDLQYATRAYFSATRAYFSVTMVKDYFKATQFNSRIINMELGQEDQ